MEMEKEYQEEEELELGLGLTLNCGGYLTTNSPPPPPKLIASQIVGWPPIRTYRMNSLVNQTKIPDNETDKGVGRADQNKATLEKERGHFGYVKVNMDGMQIGRKVDLNAHSCYQTLAQALEDMFLRPSINSVRGEKQKPTIPSKLLDGSSEFVLTYEDKEGDSMLVGDVPWRMFLNTVKRLRIMKTSEAGGLAAPRSQERNTTEKNKRPI